MSHARILDALHLPITGIGSLPHPNLDSALEYSFRHSIPFLPQLPLRNPWEFMLGQALAELPGLIADPDGMVSLDTRIWEKQKSAFDHRLAREADSFEPSASTSGTWQSFAWELAERKTKIAKIQIAGPMTCQWAIKVQGDLSPTDRAILDRQILGLVLNKAIAMGRRLMRSGTQPVLYIDEPGLYGLATGISGGISGEQAVGGSTGLSTVQAKQLLGLKELGLMIQLLQKEGIIVGLHCCSNTAWRYLLELPVDLLSIDVKLSLKMLLSQPEALERFLERGGRVSLGIVPTTLDPQKHGDADDYLEQTLQILTGTTSLTGDPQSASPTDSQLPALSQKLLQSAWLTPACGLALLSPSAAEDICQSLVEIRQDLLRVFPAPSP